MNRMCKRGIMSWFTWSNFLTLCFIMYAVFALRNLFNLAEAGDADLFRSDGSL